MITPHDPVVANWRRLGEEARAKGDRVMADFYANAIADWHADVMRDFRDALAKAEGRQP